MKCPNCGSDMVLRVARRGPNAGNKFYGCTNYPRCKYIIDISDSEEKTNFNFTNTDYSDNISNIEDDLELPVFLLAREKFKDSQVRFYESLALSKSLLDKISTGDINKTSLKNLNQWRLDYPIIKDVSVNENLNNILLVAYKILTRCRN